MPLRRSVHTDARSTDYVFKHALVRDALYQSLLTQRRQELHAKIAEETSPSEVDVGERLPSSLEDDENVLDGIRRGATRFETAVSRGLSSFVGREHELEVLERGLAEARSQLHVIDIAAEPGMGKSRLLHEFRQRVGKERAFVLSGNCSPDGQQTPFLPFIEVVRGS